MITARTTRGTSSICRTHVKYYVPDNIIYKAYPMITARTTMGTSSSESQNPSSHLLINTYIQTHTDTDTQTHSSSDRLYICMYI